MKTRIVPEEPTEEMIAAYLKAVGRSGWRKEAKESGYASVKERQIYKAKLRWRAMLNAAPVLVEEKAERTGLDRALGNVVSVSMAMAHQMRTAQPYDNLREKFLRATRRLERVTGKR